MKLVNFIDNRFQELRIKEQEEEKKQTYSVTRDSEVLALQAVLKALRTVMKWLMIPKVLGHYLMTLIGAANDPVPAILNKLKADQKSKELVNTTVASVTNLKTIDPQKPA